MKRKEKIVNRVRINFARYADSFSAAQLKWQFIEEKYTVMFISLLVTSVLMFVTDINQNSLSILNSAIKCTSISVPVVKLRLV